MLIRLTIVQECDARDNHSSLDSGETINNKPQIINFYCPCAKLYAFLLPHIFNNSKEQILKLPLMLT